jgi:predicted transposase/invertase (TIGR01784 family)
MQNQQNLIDFLKTFLPENLTKFIDFNSIKTLPTENFQNTQKKFLDLAIECKIKNTYSHIYIILEHKSYRDKSIFLQILNYASTIWEKDLKNQKSLTPIIPLVFYHGNKKWNIPTNLKDLFPIPENTKSYILAFSYLLTDTNNISPNVLKEILIKNIYLYYGISLLKSIFNEEELKEILKEVIGRFYNNLKENKINEWDLIYLRFTIAYTSKRIDKEEIESIMKSIGGSEVESLLKNPWVEEGIKEGIKKGKEIGLQEGLQKGLQKGLQEGLEKGEFKAKIETAKKMKKKGYSIKDICEITGLSKKDLKKYNII